MNAAGNRRENMRTFTIKTRSECQGRLNVLRAFAYSPKALAKYATEIAELEALLPTLPEAAPAADRQESADADAAFARFAKVQQSDINAERRARRSGGRYGC